MDVQARVKSDPQWQNKTYVPHASTNINQKRWLDEWEPEPTINLKALSDGALIRKCNEYGIRTRGRTDPREVFERELADKLVSA